MAKLEAALGFVGFDDLAKIGRRRRSRNCSGMKERMFSPTISSTERPRRFGGVGVDAEEPAVEVVGADHAERALDELAIAGFGLAEGGSSAARWTVTSMPVAMMKVVWFWASTSAVADQAMRRREPSLCCQWFSKTAGNLPERSRSKEAMASGMSLARG